MRRAGAAAKTGGHAGMQRVFHLLRADEVDMAVHTPCGQNATLARDDFGAGADDNIDARLRIGIARFADGMDQPVF